MTRAELLAELDRVTVETWQRMTVAMIQGFTETEREDLGRRALGIARITLGASRVALLATADTPAPQPQKKTKKQPAPPAEKKERDDG
jgi:hypothetical protein